MSAEPRPGLTIVYTGQGKGKTTAAFGLALRMVGHGWKVLVLQFLKGPIESGERLAARRLQPELTVRTLGSGYVCLKGAPPSAEERALARTAWLTALQAISEHPWDAVILDEVNVLTSLGLLSVDEVMRLVETRPPSLTLVLTGRDADRRLCHVADIVTDMSAVRHVYHTGRADIPGIDR